MLPVQCFDAALRTALTLHPPSGERPGEAFQTKRAEGGQLKQAAHEPPSRLADHHRAGRCERLQSCRKVWRFADRRLVPGCTRADQVADHYLPSGDSHAGLQPYLGMGLQLRDRRDQLESGAYGPLGVVLVRSWPAEIGQYAVAYEFVDVSLEAINHCSCGALVSAHNRTHVLGVELRRECGRADQVAEQHRQLAAFGGAGRVGFSQRAAVRLRELGDRAQELLAVPEREPELLQVLVGQVR
jgi:hypothetical protein